MKNLNLKHYQQAYHHPYEIPANNTHQQHFQHSCFPPVDTFNSNQKLTNSSETYNYTPTNSTNYIDCKNLPRAFNSSTSNNSQTPSLVLSSPTPQPTPIPPTLGGYLANQQQQRLQQHQQQLHQSFNHHTPTTSQPNHNMLSLNQTNTLNYNFYFNANSSNNGSCISRNFNANTNTHHRNNNNNNSHNNNNNINNNSNHNNRALFRPQRPNSLNISAMASLATPSAYSSYSSMAQTTNGASPSTCHSAPTASCNFSANNSFHNSRENLFNFSINQQPQQQLQQHQQQQQLYQNYNNHNYTLQQHQENYNNYQANQQHQQHLQQFQLLQKQLKQQQQNQHFQINKTINRNITNHCNNINNNNNNCNLTTPAALSTTPSANQSRSCTSQCTTSSSNSGNNAAASSSTAFAGSSISETTANHCDKLTMDAGEIANFLANELFMQQLVSMECMQTGVPTLTTPTLTPTTLKSIEESFIQLTSEPINAPYQAGFIPPPLASYVSTPTNTTNNNNSVLTTTTTSVAGISPNAALNNIYVGDTSTGASLPDYGNMNDTESENSQGSWTANHLNEENSMATTDTSSAATDTISFQNGLNGLGVNTLNNSNSSTNEFTTLAALAVATAAAKISNAGNHNYNTSSSATTTTTPSRRGGGRRPTTNSNMTPEEEEKRRIRRERNKLAAARCRKRRVDQTNELTEEVQMLEKKREELQKQIESLNGTKQDLEFLLEAHRPTCQRVEAADILSVNTFEGLMPATISTPNDNITGIDTSLATTARSISPLDLKPVLNDQLLAQIKDEPLDSALDSNSSLDQDGPPSPKRLLLSNNNPMIPPPLPNVATLSASLAAASASLNTPIVTTAPVSFGTMYSHNPSLSASLTKPNSKQRPNSLPTIPRSLAQNLGLNVNENKPPTDINGVAIQTPSTGMFNFDSLMDGGTGLTPVSGPLVPNCSSQNKHPLELVTPTSEPSKLVSL